MATKRGSKPSVFTAFNQLRVAEDVESDDGSAEERQLERQEKQKQKKKSRSKKKNSDSAQLKDLAFVSVSKPKKSKSKKKEPAPAPAPTTTSPSQLPTALPVNEPRIESGDSAEKKQEAEAEAGRPLEPLIQTPAVPNGTKKKKPPSMLQQQQQKKKTASPREQQPLSQAPQQVPPAVVSPIACPPLSSSETELGAVYTPSHITITRVDGQMKRTVAVTEVMDQLLCYTQQNSQLLIVQDQLRHANRSLQDQLLRRDEIITGLQHEVTMFRQMCLNLQAEVSLLRSTVAPTIGSNANAPPPHRPPPGMS